MASRRQRVQRARQPPAARPDRPNKKEIQRRRPPHPGEEEQIAARRVQALNLRKAGASYRAIAQQLGVDVSTAWSDVQAELGALRALATTAAEDVRALELQRLDALTAGLFVKATQQGGDARAVMALVRVSDRRAKLLGLDAPVKVQPVAPERPFEALDDDALAAQVAQARAVVDDVS